MLLLRFLPVDRGGIGSSYPQLNNARSWYDRPLLTRSDNPDSKIPLSAESADSTLRELKGILTSALGYDAEVLIVAKKTTWHEIQCCWFAGKRWM